MNTLMLPRWLACLCLLPWLASCGLFQPRPAPPPRTEIIEVPTIAYQPLPGALTAPIPGPPAPPLACRDGAQAVPCVLDALATIPAWQAALDLCNADRRRAAALGVTDGQ